MIFSGNALRNNGVRVSTYGSQTDIAATLLGQLGLDSSEFLFSRDMLRGTTPGFAFYSSPNAFAISDSSNTTIIDIATGNVDGDETSANNAKAYIQTLFNYLDSI